MTRQHRTVAKLLALSCASLFISNAGFADESDEWSMVLGFPMVWAPAIEGHVEVDGERTEIDVGFDDLVENLALGIIGEFYANKGNWGGVVRFNYLVMESDVERSGILNTTVESETGLGLGDFLLAYKVHPDLQLIAGARVLYSKIDLTVKSKIGDTVVIDRDISITDSSQWDLLVGFNYSHRFNDQWALILNADYGIHGDNDRNMGIDLRGWYSFNPKHSIWFGYKALNIYNEFKEDGIESEMDMTQHGPTVGYAYTF